MNYNKSVKTSSDIVFSKKQTTFLCSYILVRKSCQVYYYLNQKTAIFNCNMSCEQVSLITFQTQCFFEAKTLVVLTLFRMRGGRKALPTIFFPVTISPPNFLTISFKPFATLVQNFKFVPSASSKLLNLNEDHPSKKQFFWSNPYKTEVVITSLIEMLQLRNFGHMNKSTI